jgi:hypothetical protein
MLDTCCALTADFLPRLSQGLDAGGKDFLLFASSLARAFVKHSQEAIVKRHLVIASTSPSMGSCALHGAARRPMSDREYADPTHPGEDGA